MRVSILNENFECDNTQQSVDEILRKTDEILNSSSLILDYIQLNEVQVYSDFYENMINNLEKIDTIQVVLKSRDEMENDFFNTAHEFLEGAISDIDNVISALYTEDEKELGDKFNYFLNCMDSVTNALDFLIKNEYMASNSQSFDSIHKEFSAILQKLGEVTEAGDRVYMSDIILYEVKPSLEALDRELSAYLEDH